MGIQASRLAAINSGLKAILSMETPEMASILGCPNKNGGYRGYRRSGVSGKGPLAGLCIYYVGDLDLGRSIFIDRIGTVQLVTLPYREGPVDC